MPEQMIGARKQRTKGQASEGSIRGQVDTAFYVVSYDIGDDRRRGKVHKMLSGFGEWQQYSLFECFLTAKQYLRLEERLHTLTDARQDRVRVYRLCSGCLGRVCAIGQERPQERTTYII